MTSPDSSSSTRALVSAAGESRLPASTSSNDLGTLSNTW